LANLSSINRRASWRDQGFSGGLLDQAVVGIVSGRFASAPRASVADGNRPEVTMRAKTMASYFGLRVEVIDRMADYSLIRFQGREFIVDTADLVMIYVCAA
jgi:hypothetical protein